MRLLAKEVTYFFVIFEKGKMGIKNGLCANFDTRVYLEIYGERKNSKSHMINYLKIKQLSSVNRIKYYFLTF
jgi:hypothetical protein